MANLTPEELELQKKITKELETQARLRLQLSSSIESYIEGLEDLKHKQKVINDLEKQQKKLQEEMGKLSGQDLKEAEIKLEILKEQQKIIKDQHETLEKALKTIKKSSLVASEMGDMLGKGAISFGKSIGNLDGIINRSFNKLKGLGLFEMDKAIKQSALEMGVLSKEAKGYRTSIENVAKKTTIIGIGVKELTELQSNYTDELGRNVMMSEKGMEAMADIAASTGLGAQGTAKMAADMENVGLSTERVGDFVQKSLNKSHKLGLNATKTMKNLTSGMKLLNRYNFKDGIHGLDKMARIVTKLGVSMEFAAGFADKIFNVEGAVDASAQLQVLGGEWAKLADPFHLMYMARNDLAGLTEELGKAAESSVEFDAKTKTFSVRAGEMHRLKVVSEQTGVALEDLVQAGKNAAKFTKIKSQLNFSIGGGEKGKEMQEFITNKSFLDEKGKAFIKIGNDPKLLSQLTSADKLKIKGMMEEEKTMKERAEESKTFDETLTNFINGLKVSLMPFVEAMEPMIGGLQDLSKKFFESEWPAKIEKLASQVGGLVTTIGSWIIDNPIEAAMIYAGTKVTGFLFEKANWILNGLALAKGFNMGASGTGGITSTIGNLFKSMGGGAGSKVAGLRAASSIGKSARGLGGMAGGLLSAGVSGYDEWTENSAQGMSNGRNAAKTGIRAGSSGLGAWGGAAGGAAIGTMIFPGVGTAIGGLLGGIIGGLAGDKIGDIGGDFVVGKGAHDAILSGGVLTPLDKKDDLLAMKEGGAVDKAMNQESNSMKVDFGEIIINGKIEVYSPGAPGLAIDLMKDPQFKRDISRVVSSEIEKNRNGGKNRG